ncbi:MAG TPA: DUF2127 domain-containing protein [Thermoleophilaceae bacterium]|nr:DUF2127 domain-containing protein [Thermoleophilaceae bacterium]
MTSLPGVEKPRRFRPKFHYELIACGFAGHELIGTDAAELRPEDALVARAGPDGLRWYRCLRCDSWLPLPKPAEPARQHPPERWQIELPLRGLALRDKIVLRLIAIDRALHFVVLSALAVAIFFFAANSNRLRHPVFKVLADIQSGLGGPARNSRRGVVYEIHHLFSLSSGTLTKVGIVVCAYAVLEGAEAIGLWRRRRWAEYLTFVATTVLLPLEIYEIANRASALKALTLAINIAVVVYLLLAKRLFGLRGGARAEQEERARDSGWEALERATPGLASPAPSAAVP